MSKSKNIVIEKKDTVSKNTVSKDTVSKDTVKEKVKNTVSKDTVSKDTVSKDTVSKDTVSKNTASKDTVSKDTVSKEKVSKDTVKEKVKDTVSKDMVGKKIIIKKCDESKSKGKGRFADVDAEGYPNKETAFVEGVFNVKKFKAFAKERYTDLMDKNSFKKKFGKDGEEKKSTIGAINVHFGLALISELLCVFVLDNTVKFVSKNIQKADMYEITLTDILNCIRENSDLRRTFGYVLTEYKPMNYSKMFCEDKKAINKLIENKCLGTGSQHIILEKKEAFDFLCFMLVDNCNRLIDTSFEFREYSKKTNVDLRAIICAAKIHYSGDLRTQIIHKLDGVWNQLKNDKKEKVESENDDKKISKKDKTVSKKEESDSGTEAETDEAETDSSNSDSESDSE